MSRARALLPTLCGVAIALVFAGAAVPKLIDPGSFAADIENYRVVPDAWAGHIALYLPALELVIALALLWPRYRQGAALLATGCLLAFGVAMAQARVRGIDLSCGCFGAAFESKVSWWTVVRSGVLALVAAVPLLSSSPRIAVATPAVD
ncbi:MAG: MauE/DoxX family redox-associated membrane protein [Polyangiales bacterium]